MGGVLLYYVKLMLLFGGVVAFLYAGGEGGAAWRQASTLLYGTYFNYIITAD